MTTERISYDEFGLFHENAAEFGLPFDEPPTVRREPVSLADGRHLSALAWGEGDPEIVLLHGGAQNAHTWDTVALALRPRSLVAIDLPGHGHSDGPGEAQRGDRSPASAAVDVAIAVRELAPNAKAIVGMSFGGLITIALSAQAPDLVRKVLLVDVLPGLKAKNAKHIVDFVNGPATFPSFADILARTMEFNPTRSESSMRRGILHNALQLEDGSWVWRHSRWRVDESGETTALPEADATADPAQPVHQDLSDSLGQISVPVALARGMRKNSVLRDDDEAELLTRLPGATVHRFDEAGHSIQGDMPIELAAMINDFVRD